MEITLTGQHGADAQKRVAWEFKREKENAQILLTLVEVMTALLSALLFRPEAVMIQYAKVDISFYQALVIGVEFLLTFHRSNRDVLLNLNLFTCLIKSCTTYCI